MRVTVEEWSAVATWIWDVKDPDDVCGICQNNFDGVCGSCKTPRGGDDCPLLIGECTHVFHMHCILKWLDGDSKNLCPMCKREWVAATAIAYQAEMEAQEEEAAAAAAQAAAVATQEAAAQEGRQQQEQGGGQGGPTMATTGGTT